MGLSCQRPSSPAPPSPEAWFPLTPSPEARLPRTLLSRGLRPPPPILLPFPPWQRPRTGCAHKIPGLGRERRDRSMKMRQPLRRDSCCLQCQGQHVCLPHPPPPCRPQAGPRAKAQALHFESVHQALQRLGRGPDPVVNTLLALTGARALAAGSQGLLLTWDGPESLDVHCLIWMLRTSRSPAQVTRMLRDLTP